jgi:hypothetical protein
MTGPVKSPVHELHSRSLGECTRSVRSVLVVLSVKVAFSFYTLLLPWIQLARSTMTFTVLRNSCTLYTFTVLRQKALAFTLPPPYAEREPNPIQDLS